MHWLYYFHEQSFKVSAFTFRFEATRTVFCEETTGSTKKRMIS